MIDPSRLPLARRDSSVRPAIRVMAILGGVVKTNKLLVVLLGLLTVLMIFGSALAQTAATPAQTAPKAPIILKGSPMGAVKFDHASHLKVAGKCIVCHHASKSQKPLTSPQEACTNCHTHPATPPVTTALQGAFHNPTATAGLCIDCHKKQNNVGKAAPVNCADCHQKVNG
jgi:Class III cytochrome C family